MEQKGHAMITTSEAAIIKVNQDMILAEQLVKQVLEPGVDFGIHPGTKSLALKDPGANKIFNAFECYPTATILHVEETPELIAYRVQVSLLTRGQNIIVGTGIGSCSTMEAKYGYRWVENPEIYGYTKDELGKPRSRDGVKKYRILNPEIQDLGNTIFRMATKRAEGDACNTLPGVGSALTKLFNRKSQTTPEAKPDWKAFWGKLAQLGIAEDEAHDMLKVKSFKEWLDASKTLDQALEELAKLQAASTKAKETPSETPPAPPTGEKKTDPLFITEADIPNIGALFQKALDYWDLPPTKVLTELNFNTTLDLEASGKTPYECFQELLEVRKG